MCGIVKKCKNFLTSKQLLVFYNLYIKPKIQYGVLIYGCTTKTNLTKMYTLQKRIVRVIFNKRYHESTRCLFDEFNIMSVYELHAYELLKLGIKYLCEENDAYENLLTTITHTYQTRRNRKGMFTTPIIRGKSLQRSLRNRSTILMNFLKETDLFDNTWLKGDNKQLKDKLHKFADLFLVQNETLMKLLY